MANVDTPILPPPRRMRRKQARPGEILEAALALFAERGFAATKLEDVAAKAGVSKGTLYLYFLTKEDLFRAVVRQGMLPNLEAMEARIASHDGPVATLLGEIADRWCQVLDSDISAIPKIIATESGNFPEIARFYAEEVAGRGKRLLQAVIAQGVARGELRALDPELALPLFVAPFIMMVLWKHSLGRHTDIRFQPRQVIETHLQVWLRGMAAAPGAVVS